MVAIVPRPYARQPSRRSDSTRNPSFSAGDSANLTLLAPGHELPPRFRAAPALPPRRLSHGSSGFAVIRRPPAVAVRRTTGFAQGWPRTDRVARPPRPVGTSPTWRAGPPSPRSLSALPATRAATSAEHLLARPAGAGSCPSCKPGQTDEARRACRAAARRHKSA